MLQNHLQNIAGMLFDSIQREAQHLEQNSLMTLKEKEFGEAGG